MIISIITVNYNNKNGLEQTIQSVINQTYNNIDFIVVDGDSKDGSKDIINNYASHFAYFVSEPDTGIYQAMNKGIVKAKGEYILFLNSGDRFYNTSVIETVIPLLNSIDVVSGDIILEDLKGDSQHVKSKDEVTLDFFLNVSLHHQATFIKKELFNVYGLYNETLKIAGDYEFFVRILYKNNCSFLHINTIISCFKTDGISNDLNYLPTIEKEIRQSWLLNVSERTFKEFESYHQLLQSDEVYLKSRSRLFRFTTKLSKFIYSIRLFLYKKFREKKRE